VSRLPEKFAQLKKEGRAGFVPFITAGDPDFDTSLAILERLPKAGADIIELGIPFSDPMADGPAIQASSLRALKSGMNVKRTLEMVARFRKTDSKTPIVLMGYFNPIHAYGLERFAKDAATAGTDGLIVVDLGPEEDSALRALAAANSLDIVRLATPTTDDARLPTVLDGASGYLYYVAVAGVTGTKSAAAVDVGASVARIRKKTTLPVCVGFGIRTPEEAAAIARVADAAVVGSAIVSRIAEGAGKPRAVLAEEIGTFCWSLAKAVHDARVTNAPSA